MKGYVFMNIQERAEKASKLKLCGKYNCCQAVLSVLADETEIDEEHLNMLGAGFAAGMGNMEGTCGSLVGAAIIAGLKTNGNSTLRFTRKISEIFSQKCGAAICKTIKGKETGIVLCPCEQCVKNAVLAYGEVMGLE